MEKGGERSRLFTRVDGFICTKYGIRIGGGSWQLKILVF